MTTRTKTVSHWNRRLAPILARYHQGTWFTCVAVLFLSLGHVLASPAIGRGPNPPCNDAPWPPYADVEMPINVRVWSDEDFADGWSPPACTGWKARDFTILVAAAGRFRHEGKADEILQRIAAISNLTEIWYWSVTRGRWHKLISEAFALSAPNREARRLDFDLEELRPGRSLYFWQDESSPAGAVVYRLRILERDPDRITFDIENTERVTFAFMTLFEPGEYQFLYFLERESSESWRYYSLFRAGAQASSLISGHENSFINRAVAVYRYLAGLPTDRDPPAAP